MSLPFLERFSPPPTKAEYHSGSDLLRISHPELATQSEIAEALRRNKVETELINESAVLIFSVADGMRQEYEQYEAKGLKIKRASLCINFYVDEYETENIHYDTRSNQVILPFQKVQFDVQNKKYLGPQDPHYMQNKIYTYRLWGGEEANHSIFRQFKKKYMAVSNALHGSPNYNAQEHEFRALQSNIRQAEREKMSEIKIAELKKLLDEARKIRAKKSA